MAKGNGGTYFSPFSTYGTLDLWQDPGRAAESSAEAGTCGRRSREMRVWLSADGSRGRVEPVVGLAMRLRALGTQVRVCAAPDCAASERCDALVAIGVAPTGGSW